MVLYQEVHSTSLKVGVGRRAGSQPGSDAPPAGLLGAVLRPSAQLQQQAAISPSSSALLLFYWTLSVPLISLYQPSEHLLNRAWIKGESEVSIFILAPAPSGMALLFLMSLGTCGLHVAAEPIQIIDS